MDMFYAAPFGPDGALIGVGQWRLTQLSPRWLEFCRQFLTQHGGAFQGGLPVPLHRVELRLTSAEGAALATFSAAGQLAASAAYFRGENRGAEQELLVMFVESLRRTTFVQQRQTGPHPFEGALDIDQRPLYIVVPWANPAVTDEDYELVKELGNHLAAAFLCG